MKQIFLFKRSNCHCPRSVCVMKSLKVTSHYKYSKSVGAFFDKWTDREMENGFEEERLEGDSWRKPIRTNKQALPVLIRVFPCGRIVIWQWRDFVPSRARGIFPGASGEEHRDSVGLCVSRPPIARLSTLEFSQKKFLLHLLLILSSEKSTLYILAIREVNNFLKKKMVFQKRVVP